MKDAEKYKHEQYSGSRRKSILINESGMYSLNGINRVHPHYIADFRRVLSIVQN